MASVPRTILAFVVATLSGCAAGAAPTTPPASLPAASAFTSPSSAPATPSPTASLAPAPTPTPAPTPWAATPIDPAHATWTRVGRMLIEGDTSMTGLVGFAGGYVSTGMDHGVPVAWFTPDGVTWTSTPLGEQEHNCPGWGPDGDDLVWNVETRSMAAGASGVVIVGELMSYDLADCGSLRPVSWHSVDGRHWRRSEPWQAPGDLRATAVWAAGDGWRAMSDTAVWASDDGVAWTSIAPLTTGTDAFASTPDGTMMRFTSDEEHHVPFHLTRSTDGVTWTDVTLPKRCTQAAPMTAPTAPGQPWTIAGTNALCASPDGVHWTRKAVDAMFFGAAQTRFGSIALGDACYGAGVTCKPDLQAWLTSDGETWVRLPDQPRPWSWGIADGPAGVLFLGGTESPSVTAWRLDP